MNDYNNSNSNNNIIISSNTKHYFKYYTDKNNTCREYKNITKKIDSFNYVLEDAIEERLIHIIT